MKFTLGRQDFRDIRERELIYVDKTEEVCRVAELRTFVFLSRPRRFGKSLTVSTLAELYSGDRALFAGLWAYDHWDFAGRESSVIYLEFAGSGFADSGLRTALHRLIDDNAAALGVSGLPAATDVGPSLRLRALVQAAAAASPSGRAVLLVDEYDKPITHHIEGGAGGTLDEGIEETLRELRAFYGVLKGLDKYLELVFITGVSAFARVSLFSDLNNLFNISLQRENATLVGLTERELTTYFAADISETGVSREVVRKWYNGYRFAAGAERVYNPWSVLAFLRARELDNHWYGTGSPAWLLRMAVRLPAFSLDDLHVAAMRLTSFDVRDIDVVGLLYQTGYLTIVSYDPDRRRYRLDYPNWEVREAFGRSLLDALSTELPASAVADRGFRAQDALAAGDVAAFLAQVDALLAGIPYPLWEARRESAYHLVAHTLLQIMGARATSEVATARGRADTVVETEDFVYGFEFKVDRPVAEALTQIRERGYLDGYTGDGRRVMAVGVSFDSGTRRVGDWGGEEVG